MGVEGSTAWRLGIAEEESKAWRRASAGTEKDGGSWIEWQAFAKHLAGWSGWNEVERSQTRIISLAGRGAVEQTWQKEELQVQAKVPACLLCSVGSCSAQWQVVLHPG